MPNKFLVVIGFAAILLGGVSLLSAFTSAGSTPATAHDVSAAALSVVDVVLGIGIIIVAAATSNGKD